MGSKNAARDHINEINEERSSGSKSRNVKDLEEALQLLSVKLYRNDAHFLLELIQNADDNEYETSKPTFSLTLTDDALVTHCNEKGFTPANVEAICRIGNSSKAKSSGGRGYIGEKGIGFKSVFKVSSWVSIFSREYSFRFNRARPLGMITPIWEEHPQAQFPQASPEGGTYMRLHLSDDCNKERLRQEVTSFDPNILIFLKTLQEITLTVADSDIQRVLRRVNEQNAIKILENDKEILHYATFTYTVRNMPSEPRREDINNSDILLAFPVEDTAGQLAAHQVYAFLPIREYGFKFLIQADFLLTPNREDMDTSSWNSKLRDSIPRAFIEAVNHLNSTSLRFTWPRYIPSFQELQPPFSITARKIEAELRASCVLKSEDPSDDLKQPSSLTFVPEPFTFEDPKDGLTKALALNGSTRSRYLSREYTHDDAQRLMRLSLPQLDFPTFLEDLKVHLGRQKDVAKNQPEIWHRRLAALLIQELQARPYPESVFELQIIPLRGGQWISAGEANDMLFFPSQDTSELILKDMPIMEIDPDVLRFEARAELFRRLGAKPFNDQEICRAIVQLHTSLSSTGHLSVESLVSQILFLFQHSWKTPKGTHMWVVTETGQRVRASKVYSLQWEVGDEVLPILHRDYTAKVDSNDRKSWEAWLANDLGVQRVPRLVECFANTFRLSSDMNLIRDKWPSPKFLKILRDNQVEYSEWLDDRNGAGKPSWWAACSLALKSSLAETMVQCLGEPARARLNETILLPAREGNWTKLAAHFPVLDVPQPEHRSWWFLRDLGVRDGTNAELYLEILETARRDKRSGDYGWVYEAMQDIRVPNSDAIKKGFSKKPLIFIPATKFSKSQWVTVEECVWSGPEYLRRTPVLRKTYRSCSSLFWYLLGIKGTNTEILVNEARKIQDSDSIDYVVKVFSAIGEFARRDELDQEPGQLAKTVTSLQDCQIFPIELERYKKGSEGRHMLRSWTSEPTWFIADRPHLRECFADEILLLAFDVAELQRMAWIRHLPGMEKRLLSKVAFCQPSPELQLVPDDPHTELFRTRAKFIARLIPRSWPERETALSRLKSAVVYGADGLEVTWVVKNGSDEQYSKPIPSRGLAISDGQAIQIYMDSQDIKLEKIPLVVAESLSACCGIPDSSIATLWLLLTCKEEHIEDELAWRGVPELVESDLSALIGEDEVEQVNEDGPAQDTLVVEKPKVQPEEEPDSPRISTAKGPIKEVIVHDLPPPPTNLDSTAAQQIPEAEQLLDESDTNHDSAPADIIGEGKDASSRTRPTERGKEARSRRTLVGSTATGGIPAPPRRSVQSSAKTLSEVVESFSQPADAVKIEDLAQLPYIHGRNKFSLTGRAYMIFVPNPQDLPQLSSTATPDSDGFTVLPACMQLTKDGDRTIFIARNSTGTDDHELAFLAQALVSNKLKEVLGDSYCEGHHWTSPMRCRLTRAPVDLDESKHATFTIAGDKGANLTEFLIRNSYQRASAWREESPRYHIEVQATAGDRESPFVMRTSMMEMARKYRLKSSTLPSDVFILICISNSQEKPELRLFVDPWAYYSAGRLKLKIKADYADCYLLSIVGGWGIKDPEWIGAARHTKGFAERFWDFFQKDPPARSPSPPPPAEPSVWKPLSNQENATRLLCLEPGDGIQELHGELKEVSLVPRVDYEYFAISYAWGSSLKQFFLHTPRGRIPLTASLYLGLKRLRHRRDRIWIWADAICINQDDKEGDDEKACQIRLMANIFESAARVYIWLGEEEDESQVALQFLEKIASTSSPEVDGPDPKRLSAMDIPKVEDPKWGTINKLLERKWFRRVWVTQELVLAQEAIVVCGAHQIPWDKFHAAIKLCFDLVEREGFSFLLPRQSKVAAVLHLGEFRLSYRSDRKNQDLAPRDELLTLLERFQLAEATRQRDKLFALLSLAKDGKEYTPNYKIPLRQIVYEFAGVLVKRGRTMELLSRARGYSAQFPQFPSWIPNWMSSPYPDTISRWPSRTGSERFAAAKSLDSVKRKPWCEESVLCIHGCKLASIEKVGRCRSNTNAIRSYLNEIFSTVDDVYSNSTKEEVTKIKCQLPIGNACKGSRENWYKGDRHASFLALTEHLERHKEAVEKTESQKLLGPRSLDILTVSDVLVRQLQPYMFTALDFAELFSSAAVVAVTAETRLVGIVPATAQEGDSVVLFGGSEVPFLIRQDPSSPQYHHVVGECYFHGLMYGERRARLLTDVFRLH
ncbi:hypothetical protein B0T10DRAFT_145765 [Thelonectria olida]|uniref:Heterokaryon incompatibility domain-containing protein n=1 Tax=Thelonectria olida TaxID=1576542 RepID=A0A9P8VWD5_9HYPO|nr:hypothetical protein B0T10DRAFT_145765 [Thelonectria olida]